MSRLREALWATPGPSSRGEALLLAAKGFLMGAADIIPGVSGGTMAFITGIYDDLVSAIRSFDLDFARSILRFDLSGAVSGVHLRFLIPLAAGILVALLSMAGLMHHLLTTHPVPVWSLFFGLIAASALAIGRCVAWNPARVLAAAAGAAAGYVLVGIIPMATPQSLWFVFLCGSVAICAMILPGISGAFILLILGKYEFITGALKQPLEAGHFLVLAVFGLGCLVGLAGFSRLLHWLLTKWHHVTVALLTGLMIGAMRKIWPWKEVITVRRVGDKSVPLEWANVLPGSFGAEFWVAVGLMALGFMAVLAVERCGSKGERACSP
ncbi:undecaprenyl phosphate translocase family protein [Desulfohalovibrio reitneri]|uniref:undecaprenyl phosphate translocase family protein n=1 Tax=Desulfohalovibrio reitneri TaxID=1307759 RepID=UPI0005549769